MTNDSQNNRYVICMKWGNKYSADYVNRLYSMVNRHLTLPFQMVCLTDDHTGIDKHIQCYPIPNLNLPDNIPERGWKKLTTFKADLYGLKGVALFLDIDIVITDNIDCFFNHKAMHNDSVMIIRDYKKPWRMVGNSSVYRFEIGAYPDLLPYFETNFAKIRQNFRHEQAFLSDYLRTHYHLEYWDKDWCVSFKYHCVQSFPKSFFVPPKLPQSAKMVIFHGEVNPPDALIGKSGKWYRKVLPTPWIVEHWR